MATKISIPNDQGFDTFNDNHQRCDYDTAVLDAIAPLRQAGFAIHWLHPREKRPIGADWSDKPVASLDQLRTTHRPGYNAGARLGEPAALTAGGYHHAFDMDIRIPDLADEAWDALRALLPSVDFDTLPTVQSGSGGESRHFHFITSRPFFGKKLAVSEGKHRTADGKWHYDWEIELFGTGKQVAIPPSIHPGTGLPYRWLREFEFDLLDMGLGPHIDADQIAGLGVAKTGTYEFENREPLDFKAGQLEGDLEALPLGRWDDRSDWIMIGQALHHQFGGSKEGFDLWMRYSAQSDSYLKGSSLAKELRRYRGFGRNRRQPVTMGTIRQWALDARASALIDQFDEVDDEGAPAPEAEPAATGDDFDDLFGEKPVTPAAVAAADEEDDIEAALSGAIADAKSSKLDWMSLLDVLDTGKGWRPTLHNLELILKHDARLVGLAQLNEFTQETVQRTAPGKKSSKRKNPAKATRQLTGRVWQCRDAINGDLWSDDRDFAIRSIIEAPRTQGGYGIKVSDRDLSAAVVLAANDNAFHPVREYLNSLTWDGTPRVERLWIDYVGAADDVYNRDVARLMMIGAVTRIFEPGHKFDFATILEGLQGKRKSTLISILGKHWFGELDGDFHDRKQMIEQMQGKWIMEIPELSGFNRSDVRSIKAFVTCQEDRARLAYARRAGEFPRQCIFIGSTNDKQYLKDDSGGRRWWPVECLVKEIPTDVLARNVDQLWAEAVYLYRAMRKQKPTGTLPLYLTGAAAEAAALIQESRREESVEDGHAAQIAAWLETPIVTGSLDDDADEDGELRLRNEVCLKQIWVDCLKGSEATYGMPQSKILGKAMSQVPGWAQCSMKTRLGKYGNTRFYARGGDQGHMERLNLA